MRFRYRTGRRIGGSNFPRRRYRPITRRTFPLMFPRVTPSPRTWDLGSIGDRTNRAFRFGTRGPGSVVSTKMMKVKNQRVRVGSDSNSKSFFVRKALPIRGFRRKVFNASPLLTRKTENSFNISWAYGNQTVYTFTTNTNGELDTIKDLISTDNTVDFLMLNTTQRYMISNMSKAACKLKIYEGVYKIDCDNTPETLWTNGLIDMASSQLKTSIAAAPMTSRSFNTFCHVTKVYDLFLPQGRTHEHVSKYNYNRLYQAEIANVGGQTYLKGWTRFMMMVAYGEPITETDAQGGSVSTASGKLSVITTRTDRFKYQLPQYHRSWYTKSIPTTGLASELLLDEGSGEAETQDIVGD